MITYQIKNRLKEYLDSINMSVYQLEKDCGFARSYFTNVRYNVTSDKLDIILKRLPDLNREWLLTGEGEMSNGLPLSELENTFTDDEKAEIARQRREALERVREVIVTQICPTIEVYERRNHLIRGTFDRALKRGDDRVVDGWINAVYRESDRAYSYDWIATGEGHRYRIKLKGIPVFSISSLNDHFNNPNRRIKPLNRIWLEDSTLPSTPVDMVAGRDDVDFAVIESEEKDCVHNLCKLVGIDDQLIDGKYLICDRTNGTVMANIQFFTRGELIIRYQGGKEEPGNLGTLEEFSIFAKIIGNTSFDE